jgi:integrase/recombinase XerD
MAKRGRVYNRIYNENIWKEVNQYNKILMDDYLMEMRAQKKKKTTIDQYRNDLRILFIYIFKQLNNKRICDLKKKDFRNYSLWLSEECNMSNARVNRLMSALRSMLEFASNEEDYEDDIAINHASKVKGLPKEEVRDIVFLSDEQVEKIYNYLIEKHEYQKACYIAILYDSVARRNEIFQIQKYNLLDSNKTNKVVGKRGKEFSLLYFSRTKDALRLWLDQRGKDDVDSLWVTQNNPRRAASYETLYNWILEFCDILYELEGKYIPFNAHSFRHSGLENYSTGDHYYCKIANKIFTLKELQGIANHKDMSTTDSYLKDKSEEETMSAFGLF